MEGDESESQDHRDVDTIAKLIASTAVSTMALAMMAEAGSPPRELELSEATWRRGPLAEAWRNHARAEGAPLGHDRASA